MSRYIDADLLYKETEKKIKANNEYRMAVVDGEFLDLINDAPTEDDVVEVRHGDWGFDGLGWTCSECGEYALTNKAKLQVHSAWCPHCGAKMDGERKEL